MTLNRQNWGRVLAARSCVYALDLRGHGQSSRVDRAYRYQVIAQDVIEFADEMIRALAVFIGHSLGALASVKAAAEIPHLARGIVLEDPLLYAYEHGLNPSNAGSARCIESSVRVARQAGLPTCWCVTQAAT